MTFYNREQSDELMESYGKYLAVVEHFKTFSPGQELWLKNGDASTIRKVEFVRVESLPFEEFQKLDPLPRFHFDAFQHVKVFVKNIDEEFEIKWNPSVELRSSFMGFVPEVLHTLENMEDLSCDDDLTYVRPALVHHEEFPFSVSDINIALRKRLLKKMRRMLAGDRFSLFFGSSVEVQRYQTGFILEDKRGGCLTLISDKDLEEKVNNMELVNVT